MLRRADARVALIEALADCDRLVLLGDLLELRHGPLRDALAAAWPVLDAIGDAVGRDKEVVIVPGNHDHRLLSAWLERRAAAADQAPLGLATDVDWRRGEPLERVVAALSPAAVRVSYPGTWIRADVYATHGHYGDRHNTVPIVERLGAGLMARVVREPEGGPRRAEDYEATLGPMYAWVDTVAENGGFRGQGAGSLQVRAWGALQGGDRRRSVRTTALSLGFPALIFALNRAGFGPLSPDVSGIELRRAALQAFAEVIERLGVEARYVIFGHTHRAGPLPADDPAEWVVRGATRLLNTGSWVYEARFLGERPATSPYRPGFCAAVGDEGPPELLNLLEAEPGGPFSCSDPA